MVEKRVTRAPYSAPKLVIYGDLQSRTENKMAAGSDGAIGPNTKST